MLIGIPVSCDKGGFQSHNWGGGRRALSLTRKLRKWQHCQDSRHGAVLGRWRESWSGEGVLPPLRWDCWGFSARAEPSQEIHSAWRSEKTTPFRQSCFLHASQTASASPPGSKKCKKAVGAESTTLSWLAAGAGSRALAQAEKGGQSHTKRGALARKAGKGEGHACSPKEAVGLREAWLWLPGRLHRGSSLGNWIGGSAGIGTTATKKDGAFNSFQWTWKGPRDGASCESVSTWVHAPRTIAGSRCRTFSTSSPTRMTHG